MHTTPQFAKTLNFDKVMAIINRAVRANSERWGIDYDQPITYRYTAETRKTNPYRTIKFVPKLNDDKWLEVWDWPNGGHSGLVKFTFENPRLIPRGERIHREPTTGAEYTVSPPEGWK